jgi:hypothetical protein
MAYGRLSCNHGRRLHENTEQSSDLLSSLSWKTQDGSAHQGSGLSNRASPAWLVPHVSRVESRSRFTHFCTTAQNKAANQLRMSILALIGLGGRFGAVLL